MSVLKRLWNLPSKLICLAGCHDWDYITHNKNRFRVCSCCFKPETRIKDRDGHHWVEMDKVEVSVASMKRETKADEE